MSSPVEQSLFSKTEFKARALEVFRQVERTGQPVTITDHGRPTLELRPCAATVGPLSLLKGSVLRYDDPFEPIAVDWLASL